MQVVYIGIFGGLGCVARYFVTSWAYQLVGRGLPYGTLVVNILGSFLLGLMLALGVKSIALPVQVRVGMTVGFMGGFTTFSTFSYETLTLIEEGSLWHAGANVLLNVLLCLIAALAGAIVARSLT